MRPRPSRKSFFEVAQAIETVPRFHIPKLMEYVTRGSRTLTSVTFRM
jgi:hypothetical protein